MVLKSNFRFSFFSVLICRMLHAQAPVIQWQKSFGGSGIEEASAVAQTLDGGYIAAGFTQSNNGDVTGNHGGKDVWIIKTDSSGSMQWQKALGGSGDDEVTGLAKTSDGGYIFTGYTKSNNGDVSGNHGLEDAWIIKLDAMGIVKWQQVMGGVFNDRATSVQSTTDGGCIVSGYGSLDGNNDAGMDGWILKLTATGAVEWHKMVGGTGMDTFYSVQQTSDGGFIAAGNTASSDGNISGGNATQNNYESLAVKFDASGNIKWYNSFGGSNLDMAYSIIQLPDGGYVMGGYTVSPNVPGYHGNCDLWLARLNPEGSVKWQKALGGSLIDQGFQLLLCDNGDYIIAGFTGADDGDVTGGHGNCDLWMLRLNDTGMIKWQKTMGGALLDRATCIAKTTDNGYVLAGYTWSSDGDVTQNHGNDDFWMVRLLPEASLSTQSVVRDAMVLFPNPAKTDLTIGFADGSKPKNIFIYDVSGKIVIQQDREKKVGIENLKTGQYFIKVVCEGNVYTETFIKE